MRKKAPRIERAGHDRWLVSYADLVTLLLAFFTTLYAASNLDATKMAPLSSSLQEAFAAEASAATPGSTSTSPPKERLAPLPALGVFAREHTLDNLRMTLEKQLAQAVKDHDVDVEIDPRGLVVSMPDDAAFPVGSNEVSPAALGMIGKIAETVRAVPNSIRIEGHTDDVPIRTAKYGSNWELSTARAAAVVAYLIQDVGIQPSRLLAAGYGEFHPRVANDSAENRARNRRIDIVVLRVHELMLGLSPEVQQRLLDRPVREVLTPRDRAAFAGQRVLVMGAGGSVGSELSRQLAECRPATLTLVDHSEYALFAIEQELRRRFPFVAIDAVIGDVSRRVDIGGACRTAMPHVVYHAAAYKHVTIAERAIVPAARSNVIGTVETVRAARESGARFVLISSDKAAEPRSVMGATKRCAELIALSAADGAFRPIVLRFGNVLGSSGSLLEIMGRCLQEGRNIPVTHPDATRFFMTCAEAVSLILKADLIGRHPEVFWLDMGEPLRIGTLAQRFIDTLTPAGARRIGIDIIGMRPGEKMHEELTTHGLEMQPTSHPRILRARQGEIAGAATLHAVRAIRRGCASGHAGRVLEALMHAVTDFIPSNAAVETAAGGHKQCVEHVRLSAVAAASSGDISFRH